MNLNVHSPNLLGTHSFLAPSSPAWVNYDEDKLTRMWFTAQSAKRGSELHAFAAQAIKLSVRLPDTAKTLNSYVNDAIGFRMTPEHILYYSANCYGHADAIGFRNNKLRIHDLKTGVTEVTNPTQLDIYAALFCLEYRFKPSEIEIETRIYQNDSVKIFTPPPDSIFHVMDRIITFDRRINELKEEVL